MKTVSSALLLCFLLISCGEKTIQEKAEAGDVSAQFNLGVMYYDGEGVPQDYAEAAKWYRRAAEQGDPAAQNALGELYAKGQGVLEDHSEAAEWYREASEQGNCQALRNLGSAYSRGAGVPKDQIKAYMFLSLGRSLSSSSDDFKAAEFDILLITNQMTEEQRAEGRKLAKEWVERYIE